MQKMQKFISVILMLSAVTGCLTLPSNSQVGNLKFTADENRSLLTVIDLNKYEPEFTFRKVNLEQRKFEGVAIRLSKCVFCLYSGSTWLIENEAAYLRNRFLAQTVEPGHYALIQFSETHNDVSLAGFVPSVSTLKEAGCFGKGAPVFEVKEGQVNFIRFDGIDLIGLDAIHNFMERLQANLKIQPGITAVRKPAHLTSFISFMDDEDKPENCTSASGSGNSFRVISLPVEWNV